MLFMAICIQLYEQIKVVFSYIYTQTPINSLTCNTCLCNADIENAGLVFLWKVLGSGFESEGAIFLLDHLEYSNGICIG